MRHGFWRATLHRLFPDVTCAVQAVDEGNGATLGSPMNWKIGRSSGGQRKNLGELTARNGNHRQAWGLILAGQVQTSDPLAVRGNGWIFGGVGRQLGGRAAFAGNPHQNNLAAVETAENHPPT